MFIINVIYILIVPNLHQMRCFTKKKFYILNYNFYFCGIKLKILHTPTYRAIENLKNLFFGTLDLACMIDVCNFYY